MCIFAYGQTGSGKTHTKMGRARCAGEAGLVPRALQQLFAEAAQLEEARGWTFTLKVGVRGFHENTHILRSLEW